MPATTLVRVDTLDDDEHTAAGVFRALPVLALALVAVFLVVVAFVVVFLAGAFLVAAALVAVFFAAGFFAAAVLVAVFFSAGAFLVVAFAVGLLSALLGAASLIGPEAPVGDDEVSRLIERR